MHNHLRMPLAQIAAIYTRVSTDNQAEIEFNSCDAQAAKIRAFITSQENMGVHNVYSDVGYSGATMNRPALTQLLHDLQGGQMNFVIVYKIDRLTRSPRDFYQLIETFERYGVSFISVTERFDTSTPAGRLLRNIMLTFAQFERELTSERTKDKMLERAKKGLYGGGICPFGYRRMDKKLLIEPDEALIVQQIFDKYIETNSLSSTYESLKRQGVHNRNGRVFTKGDLASILRNSIRTGKIHHQGKLYPGIHEPIISQNQFDIAQEVHKRQKSLRWRPVQNFLFPGLITCKECGSTMTPAYTNKLRKNKRKRYFYYRFTCTYKRDWAACSTRHVNASRLDSYVTQSLEKIAHDNQYLESLSFMLSKNNPGVRKGLELPTDEPAITSESIKEVIRAVAKIASTKEMPTKRLIVEKHIQRIVYSKELIEIKLYAGNAFGPSYDERLTPSPASDPPKMPPPIFGRSENQAWVKDNVFGEQREVREEEKTRRNQNLQTFSIEVKNIIHGCQAKNL